MREPDAANEGHTEVEAETPTLQLRGQVRDIDILQASPHLVTHISAGKQRCYLVKRILFSKRRDPARPRQRAVERDTVAPVGRRDAFELEPVPMQLHGLDDRIGQLLRQPSVDPWWIRSNWIADAPLLSCYLFG